MPLKPALLFAGFLAIIPAIQAQTADEFDVIINEIMPLNGSSCSTAPLTQLSSLLSG
jgi:hypothetical protein